MTRLGDRPNKALPLNREQQSAPGRGAGTVATKDVDFVAGR